MIFAIQFIDQITSSSFYNLNEKANAPLSPLTDVRPESTNKYDNYNQKLND